jgi:exosome complex RNA-binding protein Csl4
MAINQLPNRADIASARIADCGLRHIAVDISGVRNVEAKVVFGSVFRSNKELILVSVASCN